MQDKIRLQPLVRLKDGKIWGYEALYQKNNNELYPSALQIISQIFSKSNLQSDCKFFINLTVEDIANKNFCDSLLKILDKKNADADKIVLEINETTRPDILMEAKKSLSLLNHHNIKIALDDFGTEYSSLFFMSEFPIDIVKIDKKFVQEAPSSHKLRTLIKHCVEISHDFGCKVVAEGIENESQLKCIENSNADLGQGFLFSAPSGAKNSKKSNPFIKLSDFISNFSASGSSSSKFSDLSSVPVI